MARRVKFGVLIASPEGQTKNIGDYIQSIAQRQFLPKVDEYVQRESLLQYDNEEKTPIVLIMNAWYMWHPEFWPPSELIIPLPVSMHLSPVGSVGMLSVEGLAWFKKHEPIGCRDYDTMKLLSKYGIKSYFTACLTLTLGKSYNLVDNNQRRGVFFVNPYIPIKTGLRNNLKIFFHSLTAPYTIISLLFHNKSYFSCAWNTSVPDRKHKWIKAIRRTSHFHWLYSQKFTNSCLRSATYINHEVNSSFYPTDMSLFECADQLLKGYASAQYVVTSRIHAALPCLGIGTPVIFVKHPDIVGEQFNGNRTAGLQELFHTISISGFHNVVCDEIFNSNLLDESFHFENKPTWKEYAEDLTRLCESFVSKYL